MRTADQFWAMSIPDHVTGCRVWARSRHPDGYGRIKFDGAMVGSHRVAWQLSHGPIPDGLQVLHRCDNPPCVEPLHLFLGTPADNMRDMAAKGRSAKNAGESNGSAILTDEIVLAMRTRFKRGESSKRDLAMEFGVCATTVHHAIAGDRWKHLPLTPAELAAARDRKGTT